MTAELATADPAVLGEPAAAPASVEEQRGASPAVPRRSRSTRRRGARSSWALTALSILVVLGVWWSLRSLDVWSDLILPSPGQVWHAFVYSSTSHEGRPGYFGAYLWEHLWASLWRVANGVARAVIIGVPLGVAIASWRWFASLVEPWVNFLRSLPPLAYFVVLIFWFGIGDASKVWLLFGAAFPPITLAAIGGVQRVRRDRIDAARALGATRAQVLRVTVLPSILPDLFTGLRVATGFAWTTIVAAETVNGLPGLGGMAWATRSQNRSDIAIMCVIVIGVTAVVIDQLIRLAERFVVPWGSHA